MNKWIKRKKKWIFSHQFTRKNVLKCNRRIEYEKEKNKERERESRRRNTENCVSSKTKQEACVLFDKHTTLIAIIISTTIIRGQRSKHHISYRIVSYSLQAKCYELQAPRIPCAVCSRSMKSKLHSMNIKEKKKKTEMKSK